MGKFFIDSESIKDDKVFITDHNFNHIKNVLRMKLQDNIIVNNGRGMEYEAKITEFSKNAVIAQIIRSYKPVGEPLVNISLFQGVPKGEKMEYIIQKSVEIGVNKIYPLVTERVVVKLDASNSKRKLERWNNVSENASKQNGRSIIPEILPPINLKDSVKILEGYDLVVILYENESNNKLRDILQNLDNSVHNIAILVGPEGGLSEKEVDYLRKYEFASLGTRILRTETAGMVAAAIILYVTGDLG